MRDFTAQEIEKVMLKLGMKVFNGKYDITFGGIRNTNQVANSFDDKIFMMYRETKGGVLKIEQWTATTDCGLYYLKNTLNRNGAGILVHDRQYKGMYEWREKGHKGEPAFRQVRPASFVRDNNKDNLLDFKLMENPDNIFEDVIYCNCHDTNESGIDSTMVGRWSAACQVVNNSKSMDRMEELAKLQMKSGHGNYFSYALIFGNHFEDINGEE